MKFTGIVYRAHDPKWAFSPLSGDGAKLTGGRFNPKGMAALYTATTLAGMLREYSQTFQGRLIPATICSYDVDCEDIVDLTTARGRANHGASLNDLACAWAALMDNGSLVPSHLLAERLIAAGVAGILTPSFAPGATLDDSNLVLWGWSEVPPHQIRVHDPHSALPRNQSSWT